MLHCLSLLSRNGHACVPNPCLEPMHEITEKSNAIMRYPKSLTSSATIAMMLAWWVRRSCDTSQEPDEAAAGIPSNVLTNIGNAL